jgi:hypothetical protein
MTAPGYSRNHPRLNISIPAYFKIPGSGGGQVPVHIQTIGKGGIMFLSFIPLGPGKELQLGLLYYSRRVEFRARGVWSEKFLHKKRALFRSGATFTDIEYDDLGWIEHIVNIHSGSASLFA